MTLVKTSDGRYFDVPEDVLKDYLVEAGDLPNYIDNPAAWEEGGDEEDDDVTGQNAPFGIRG